MGAASSGPILLSGHRNGSVSVLKEGRREKREEGRDAGKELEASQTCDYHCLCLLILWDVKTYAKIKWVVPPKSLNFKKLKKMMHTSKEKGYFSSLNM